jgi:2-dehydropantoate 2-reductase
MGEPEKKIVIVGPGAMGSLFAGLLSGPGREVWLLDRRMKRARAIDFHGVIIEQGNEKKTVKVRVTADAAEIGTADLVIIFVKAYDTEAAARRAERLVGPATEVLSLQNGVGNVETLVGIFGPDQVLGGTTAQGANVVAAGHVRHGGRGETVIGQPGGGTERADRIAEWFKAGGLETRVTADLPGLIWSKLTINAAINPLTALLGVRNGVLPELETAREIMAAAVLEVAAVCEKKGIQLLFPDPLEKALAVAKATAENISSMLQDVRAERRTEVDQINGAVAREALALGLTAPVNQTLARLIKALEQSYERRG